MTTGQTNLWRPICFTDEDSGAIALEAGSKTKNLVFHVPVAWGWVAVEPADGGATVRVEPLVGPRFRGDVPGRGKGGLRCVPQGGGSS